MRKSLAKHVIVATGSNARHLPGLPVDQKIVLDNDGALTSATVPKQLAVIGSGVIGLEMGSVWRRAWVPKSPSSKPCRPSWRLWTSEMAKEAHKAVHQAGPEDRSWASKVGEIKAAKKGVTVAYTNAKGEAQKLECRQADRLDRPRAQHQRPERRSRGPASSTSAAPSWWTTTARPTCPACGRWATWCAARCWRTRPRKKAWRWPSALPAKHGHCQLQHHPLGDLHQPRKSPGWARPSSSSRPTA